MIGFFGGTFDPPHLGHLNLAIAIREERYLDSVLFCPAAANPHKSVGPKASPAHRLAMLQLAVESIPGFSVLDWECKRPGPSYTSETLQHLAKEGRTNLRLILGADIALTLPHWHEPEAVIRLAPPLVGARPGFPLTFPGGAVGEALYGGVTYVPQMDISSTIIRHRLLHGLYCGHLLPQKVLDYIVLHRLYSDS